MYPTRRRMKRVERGTMRWLPALIPPRRLAEWLRRVARQAPSHESPPTARTHTPTKPHHTAHTISRALQAADDKIIIYTFCHIRRCHRRVLDSMWLMCFWDFSLPPPPTPPPHFPSHRAQPHQECGVSTGNATTFATFMQPLMIKGAWGMKGKSWSGVFG